jgi:hypothetical protein
MYWKTKMHSSERRDRIEFWITLKSVINDYDILFSKGMNRKI